VSVVSSTRATELDVERVRQDFPGLHQSVNGKPLVYLDNGATSQVPQVVVDAITRFNLFDRANIHRGVHTLSQRATVAYDEVRGKAAQFLGASDVREIVFTSGTTGGINLVASTWGWANLHEGDEIIVSGMEHHSNIVPWQMLCERSGAKLKVIPVTPTGELDLDAYEALLSERTRLVSIVHVSNALGTINPVRQIVDRAHEVGAMVLLDGAQATPHMSVNVVDLDCDFYVFSGHKVFGPTGVGVLWARAELLEAMPPYQGGGDMILSVSFDKTVYNDIPYKFEAGTPNIGGVIGLGAALDYVAEIGMDRIAAYEERLSAYALAGLQSIEGLRLIGTAPHRAGVFSFVVDGAHPTDIGTLLDFEGIAIRTGHHCAQPLMDFFGVSATARVSLAFYNTQHEIDLLLKALRKSLRLLTV
jgi:cysteine desulfurase/selenocysteine lyase